ncbi:hypothetical protein Mgra_00006939 [Meloidogyne graminicola]|uniref:Carboxypeptidase n=1 Tax=Meloidogyne graminicola TaxID=189291 RepID=A0A8S9ZJU1_9BILA|nr:hypothetical protein Mgra_00006939 [Meloidogyne graminicola]
MLRKLTHLGTFVDSVFRMKKIFFCLIFIFNLNLILGTDEIISLPGINFKLNFKHYSGYLDAGNNNLFHYWFVESQGNPKNDPLVLWLNGGPGCSSLGGLLNELGPYLINNDGKTLRQNLYSWNKYASIIFLESPAWVGFSYNIKAKNVTTNDNEVVAIANYAALKDFFKKYPSFNLNPLFLTGESYAGVYLPMLASKILDGMKDLSINLKGVAIGNGLLSAILRENTLLDFAYGHGFIDEHLWNNFKSKCCKCVDGCDIFNLDYNSTCAIMLRKLLNNSENALLNEYDIYSNCGPINQTNSTPNKRRLTQQFSLLSKIKSYKLINKLNLNIEDNQQFNLLSEKHLKFGGMSCVDITPIENYLNLPEVQKALNIPSNKKFKWEECPDDVFNEYYILYDEMTNFTKYFLNSNIRLMLYYGDIDIRKGGHMQLM